MYGLYLLLGSLSIEIPPIDDFFPRPQSVGNIVGIFCGHIFVYQFSLCSPIFATPKRLGDDIRVIPTSAPIPVVLLVRYSQVRQQKPRRCVIEFNSSSCSAHFFLPPRKRCYFCPSFLSTPSSLTVARYSRMSFFDAAHSTNAVYTSSTHSS